MKSPECWKPSWGEMELRGPIDLAVEVTDRCNLRCAYCYARSARTSLPFTLEQYEKLLRVVFNDIRPFSVTLTGGEPLLREDFLQVLEMTVQGGIRVAFNTNGTLINSRIARSLASLQRTHPVDVQVSLDSHLQVVHDSARQGHVQVLRGMAKLESAGVNFSVGVVLHRINAGTVLETLQWLEERGVRRIHLMNVMPTAGYARRYADFALSSEEYSSLWRSILEYHAAVDTVLDHPFCRSMYDRRQLLQKENCLAGYTRAAILQSGDVAPCSIARSLVLGNIYEDAWSAIWDSLEARAVREMSVNPCVESLARQGIEWPPEDGAVRVQLEHRNSGGNLNTGSS